MVRSSVRTLSAAKLHFKDNVNKLCFLIVLSSKLCATFGRKFDIGPCNFEYLEPCSNATIQFYLFTSDRPNDEPLQLDNINPKVPHWFDLTNANKMIIHGYAGHLDFNATKLIRMGKDWAQTV